MNPAQKKFYSVKEASVLLGVSTNTIYKYLEERKLAGRRIGRGRFKIPYKVLLPFIDPSQFSLAAATPQPTFAPEEAAAITPVEIQPKFVQPTPQESETIRPGIKDIVFFRIFKSVVFLGLGVIYIFSITDLFSISESAFEGNILALRLIPLTLIAAGLFNLAEVFRPQRFAKFHLLSDAFTAATLSYYSLVTILTGKWGLFVFTASFSAVALGHLISGLKEGAESLSFFRSFAIFSLFLGIFGGFLVVIFPGLFPIEAVTNFINANKGFSLVLWFSIFLGPLIYFLSPQGKNSTLRAPYFVLGSVVPLIIATELSFLGEWDVAYIGYLTGVIGVFLGWWISGDLKLDFKRIFFVSLSFVWISVTLILGILALRTSREQIKSDAQKNVVDILEKVVTRINSSFDERSAIITTYAGSQDVLSVVKGTEEEEAIKLSKTIYEKLGGVERVIIYNKAGNAVGVYPRNTLSQGTNFSSREYFQVTAATYKGHISAVFENILGNPSVVQTEPIFENNEFIGMIGVALELENLAHEYQTDLSGKYDILATDKNGISVFGAKEETLDQRFVNFSLSPYGKEVVSSFQDARTPNWKVEVSTPLTPLVSRLSGINVVLSVLLVVNSLFSISAAIVATSGRKIEISSSLPSPFVQKPRFV